MKRRVLEQPGDLGCKRRVQIAIRFAKDDRDRDLEVSECSAVDQRVLLVQRVEQAGGPSADGCEGIRLVGVAEELREDRLYGQAVGVESVQPPLGGGVLQQPETLAVVVDHGVGERGECRDRRAAGSSREAAATGWCPKMVLSRTKWATRWGWLTANATASGPDAS